MLVMPPTYAAPAASTAASYASSPMDTTDSMPMTMPMSIMANGPYFQNHHHCIEHYVPANGENKPWGLSLANGLDIGSVDGPSHTTHSQAVVEQPATFVSAAGSYGATQLTPSLVDSLASHQFHFQQVTHNQILNSIFYDLFLQILHL